MAELKYWTGSAWVKPKGVKRWSGSAWVDAKGMSYWNGSKWVWALSEGRLYVSSPERNSSISITERNPDTLAVIRQRGMLNEESKHIGGIASRIFCVTARNSARVYELNPDTLASIKYVSAPGASYSRGIGGIMSRLYYSRSSSSTLNELNPDTLAIIKTVTGQDGPIGGTAGRLYFLYSRDLYKELTHELVVVRSVATPGFRYGIGGMGIRLFASDSYSVYEINPDTLADIRRFSLGSPDATYNWSVGGSK